MKLFYEFLWFFLFGLSSHEVVLFRVLGFWLFISDVSGDGFLDAYELEAIFNPELEKVYNLADPNEDKNEMEEERQNMREHVLKEVDSDGDTAISMAEFMTYVQTEEFINPTNKYKMIDELIAKGELYTSEELKEYRYF